LKVAQAILDPAVTDSPHYKLSSKQRTPISSCECISAKPVRSQYDSMNGRPCAAVSLFT